MGRLCCYHSPMSRPNHALISARALQHNLARVRALMPGSRIMAAIKANAYGHGAKQCAAVLAAAGVDGFAVASIEEAEEIHGLGLRPSCTVLAGAFSGEELALASAHGHRLVIHNQEQLYWIQNMDSSSSLEIFLKVDSGMHRLGFSPAELPGVFNQLNATRNISLRILGLLSHLARSDTPEDPYNTYQIEIFQKAVREFGHCTLGEHSLPNSGAILSMPQSKTSWIRPGLMLYGLSPFVSETGRALGLLPVLTWQSQIVSVRELPSGSWLGYGAAWQAREASRVGIIACGYGDGYDRRLGNGAPIVVNGQHSRTLGRISMDLCFADLTHSDARYGDSVLLMGGKELPLEEIAISLDTIPYEIGTRIASRVPRITIP